MIHQDKFKVYISRNPYKPEPSEYSYRRDWSRGKSYFLTHKGKDIGHYTDADTLFGELKELRKLEKVNDL